MTSRLKIFLIAFLISLPFWWGVNVSIVQLEDFFYAQISQPFQDYNPPVTLPTGGEAPIKISEKPNVEVQAKSVISVLVDSQGSEKILFEKDIDQKLPIASLVKLMTANIVLKNYDLSQEIQISEEAVEQETDLGEFKKGEIFSVKELLYPLLMESSNDAAYALANDYDGMTEEKFVELMNLEAKNLGLKNTFFVNSTGLDPDNPANPHNYSTAKDLVELTKYLLKEQPLIWEILATPEFNLYLPNGVFHHKLINMNELLEEIPGIIGGKTGYTDEARGCFLLVVEAPESNGYLINIILGTEDKFGEMRKLVNWTLQ